MTDNKPTRAELEAQLADTIRRYDSLTKAVRNLESYVSDLEKRNTFLEKQLENAQLNVSQQKNSLIKIATEHNRVKDDMAQEIAELKVKLKAATNGNNN